MKVVWMGQNAYCNSCATRVALAETGECPNGHPRSALRDVREGPIAPTPAAAASRQVGTAGPNLTRSEETVAHVMGKVIVIVPAVLVVALALYTGYAMSAGMGMSKSAAWLSSIGSLAFTGVMLAVIIWIKRNRV